MTTASEVILRKLLVEMGDPELLVKPDVLLTMNKQDRASTVSAADRFLNYCLGWGVVDEPPEGLDFGHLEFVMSSEARDQMKNPYLRKAYWLRYIINEYEGLSLSDQSTLVAEITALTLGTDPHYNGQRPVSAQPKKRKPKRSVKSKKR